jgi:hypothetical protein
MRSLKLPILFCQPSFGSGLAVIFTSVALLVLSNYSYLLRSDLINGTFSPDSSSVDVILATQGTMDTLRHTILGNPTLNKILFFAFWMMIGLFAYVTLAAIWGSVAEANNEAEASHFIHARKKLVQEHMIVAIAMRVGGILALILFGVLFASLLFPFSILAARVGLSSLNTLMGWGYVLLAFAVLALSLHCFVIIGRIIMGRPRMFGGWDSVLLEQQRV